jgi:hypothetical protein
VVFQEGWTRYTESLAESVQILLKALLITRQIEEAQPELFARVRTKVSQLRETAGGQKPSPE